MDPSVAQLLGIAISSFTTIAVAYFKFKEGRNGKKPEEKPPDTKTESSG